MHADVRAPDIAPALSSRILDRVQDSDGTVLADLRFLAAWDRGLARSLASILRIRQLLRANPAGDTATHRPDPATPARAPAAPLGGPVSAGGMSWQP